MEDRIERDVRTVCDSFFEIKKEGSITKYDS